MAPAYDRVTGHHVDIGACHPVHTASEARDLSDEVVRIEERNFGHDPHEGCQGKYTLLLDKGCPKCGCNRIRRSVQTLAGVTCEICVACGEVLVEP